MKLPQLRIGRVTARLPIIQGGMSVRVSTSSLAAAVAEAGGIGTIGGTGLPVDDLRADVRRARELTKGIIAVNVMFAARAFMELCLAGIEAGADMIITGAGFSRDIFKVGRDHGVPIVSIVSSPDFARLAERSGAAAIVVEAGEAGGHLGTDRPLRELFPEVRRVVSKVPLIAAGGITDGCDIAEMMGTYGADGVQMATRFVLTKECDVDERFKRRYAEATRDDIVVIHSPVGMPGRALRNPLVDRLDSGELLDEGRCKRACLKSCDKSFCINDRLDWARDGDVEHGLVFVGANVWKIDDEPMVKDLMGRLVQEAEEAYVPGDTATAGT